MRLLYVLLSWLLFPVFIGHLLWRSLSQPGYRRRLGERLGLGFGRLPRPSIWIHAVSVGEVTAAAPLVRTLQKRFPDTPLVVTTMTPTGSQRARDLFGTDTTVGIRDAQSQEIILYCHESMARKMIALLEKGTP